MATTIQSADRPSNTMNRNNTTNSELDEKISVATLSPETNLSDTTENSSKIERNESKDLEAGFTIGSGKGQDDDVLPKVPMTFPDGGFGWLVVLGAFMIQFCTFGFNFSWGVYQEHYVNENIFPGAGLTEISWAGTIGAGSVFITGPFQSSMIRRFGTRPIIATGIVISACGLVAASFVTKVWQLYLTQGLLFGFGAGMAILPALAVPVQWFDKRRGLASGISVAGSGIGGAALAPLNRYLISRVGYGWALRIMAIIFIVVVFSVLPCIRTRVPPIKKGGPLFDLSLFKDRGFTTMYLMGVLVTFGYLTPVYLLPTYVVKYGMDKTTGATLVGIFSGVNAISRIILGIAADRYGRFNVLFTCTFLGGLSCFVFWLNAKTLAMSVVFVIFYGINGGGFVSLFPVVAAEVVGVEKLAAAVGMLYSGNLFGNMLGTPIASAIVSASGGSYHWAIVFAGAIPMVGAFLLLAHRLSIEPRLFVKV
ncbi:major facilitator superfamily domain-containing protein [Linnemannia elongata]|nr:major facilitator superfamily domain-containing protein [Linnemannia elongata]